MREDELLKLQWSRLGLNRDKELLSRHLELHAEDPRRFPKVYESQEQFINMHKVEWRDNHTFGASPSAGVASPAVYNVAPAVMQSGVLCTSNPLPHPLDKAQGLSAAFKPHASIQRYGIKDNSWRRDSDNPSRRRDD